MKRGLLALWALPFVLPAPALAEPSALRAQLTCLHADGPGRIVCELRTSASSGRLVWSDALVVRAPPFAPPLRSRCLAQPDSGLEPGVAKAKLALVASATGTAELELLARGVICREGPSGEWCSPEAVHVSTRVQVGAPAP